MGESIFVATADGHRVSAYKATPSGGSTRSLVVVQEIFGVNHHIRTVCDRFAAAGYTAIAPALFDRTQPGVELAYDAEGVAAGRALMGKLTPDGTMADIAAAADQLEAGSIGIVGYCYGGTVAWWGATETTRYAAASCWYGGGIVRTKEAVPHCPVQMHFGELDGGIPLTDVEAIRAVQPDIEIHVYRGAQHGFGCDERASFNQASYDLAQQRTLDFFARHLGA
jgi:carboxymethylenebutenolidase